MPSPAVRAADLTLTAVLFAGLSALLVMFGGVAAWIGLGPTPCLGDLSGRCAESPVGPRFVAWTLVGALALVWGLALWRVVERVRRGLAAWTVPVLGAGAGAMVVLAGTLLMAVVS
ncbi:hypothetical protein FE697_019600 [Mumia zhuanghuii]|uniref:Uncharacterized protein n=2 Tax=Mumia TaxID=1546255 RepID=A0ABW1QN20_9ACTN|nr:MULTISPECIES: hypothetical protein [Mumia]KAA1420085.1 hypothetical protein FE697_019600 [Mumia zhuanghuii]